MMKQPTRVPAMVAALFAKLREGFKDDVVDDIDGPPVTLAGLGDDVLSVGFSAPGGLSIDVQVEKQQGLGAPRYAEVFQVFMVFSSVSGDTDLEARRARCLWALTKVQTILEADRGLGGVVDAVGLGPAMEWGQDQHEDGCTVAVGFSIVGSALL
jgi:hypothetical protein